MPIIPKLNAGGNEEREESRAILNAFYVGKAVAEVLNERVSSAVGEVLSKLGRKQAEQLKEIREFQEKVEKRAQGYMDSRQVVEENTE